MERKDQEEAGLFTDIWWLSDNGYQSYQPTGKTRK